jgi:thiosulfate dehydrogenase [quinone] large subunit
MSMPRPTGLQQLALVLLRTLIGWHLAWEGFVRLLWPAWSRGGWPLPRWSAAGSLQSATGPLADSLRVLGESGWIGFFSVVFALTLVLTGLSLMLGLFTQTGATVALALLLSFWVSHIPRLGVMGPGAEGNYLYVSKDLVEAAAVFVVLLFRTGRIAGLDLLLAHRRRRKAREAEAAALTTPEAAS